MMTLKRSETDVTVLAMGVKDRVTVVLNGVEVIHSAQLPGMTRRGPIALQHHGGQRNGQWNSPPSLLQFKNIYIKPLR